MNVVAWRPRMGWLLWWSEVESRRAMGGEGSPGVKR